MPYVILVPALPYDSHSDSRFESERSFRSAALLLMSRNSKFSRFAETYSPPIVPRPELSMCERSRRSSVTDRLCGIAALTASLSSATCSSVSRPEQWNITESVSVSGCRINLEGKSEDTQSPRAIKQEKFRTFASCALARLALRAHR